MARIRNPRYAPEFLERRLSPSSVGIAPHAAEVSMQAVDTEEPLPTDQNGNPIPEPISSDGPGQTGPV
ncbi:hypothetical protein [Tautonia sociabilis]|uniref:Uncharacterized protein n=1 Tax=Tautonia sociabilis TaxID=2080755 RepID=A0A432MCJ3_9BACT|nr:hypothetical protein [Tautonia sociabilis]RUL81927.1 hypothetical protein TsocGM_24265 [Tautonia sociabilis]